MTTVPVQQILPMRCHPSWDLVTTLNTKEEITLEKITKMRFESQDAHKRYTHSLRMKTD